MNTAPAPQPPALERSHALALMQEMLRIRRFEEKAAELYTHGKIQGFLHLYIGEEAVAVGAMQALTPSDAIVSTYREHGHALARGIPAGDRLTRMQQAIATAMSRSKREIPHYYLATTIDMHRAMEWLAAENLIRSVTDRLLHGVLFLKAVALALRDYPELNAIWDKGKVVPNPAIHVGLAISLRQGGLVAPALHDTDRQSLDDLMRNLRDLVNRVRSGSLRSSEISDPTITVTSLGERGVETVFGVINPPQVALVGFGKIAQRPWSVDGQIVSRPVVSATLSADHRVSDGHCGSLFLAAVDRLLQEPSKL
jgi:pyruvate dehydrogenase E2 component (dihydrolipoamide acetyltransferase)